MLLVGGVTWFKGRAPMGVTLFKGALPYRKWRDCVLRGVSPSEGCKGGMVQFERRGWVSVQFERVWLRACFIVGGM